MTEEQILSEFKIPEVISRDIFDIDSFSIDRGLSVDDMIKKLDSYKIKYFIDIRLVGMNKNGMGNIQIDSDRLLKFFQKFSEIDDEVVVLDKDEEESKLKINEKYQFEISHVPNSVSQQINKIINEHLNENTNIIPTKLIHSILDSDYRDNQFSYTIYILNTDIYTNQTYSYSPSLISCPTSLGISNSHDYKYFFYDLSAEYHQVNPSYIQENEQEGHSLPKIYSNNHGNQHEFIEEKLLSDLSIFCMKIIKYMVTPPLSHLPNSIYIPHKANSHGYSYDDPRNHMRTVYVYIITLYEEEEEEKNKKSNHYEEQKEQEIKDTIKQSLQSLMLPYQTLQLQYLSIPLFKCPLCLQSFSHAKKYYYPSNEMNEESGASNENEEKPEFTIDSVVLHHYINKYKDTIMNTLNITTSLFQEEDIILPVFIYKLNTLQTLLIDEIHQSRSFDDMVLVIQTKAKQHRIPFQCMKNSLYIYPSNPLPSILGTLFTSLFGILPSHISYNSILHEYSRDYTFVSIPDALSNLYPSLTTNFKHTNQVMRGYIYKYIHMSREDIYQTLYHFKQYNVPIKALLDTKLYRTFIIRWNILMYIYDDISSSFSLQNYNRTLFYTHVAVEEAYNLHLMIHTGTYKLQPSLICTNDHFPIRQIFYVLIFSLILSLFFIGIPSLDQSIQLKDYPISKPKIILRNLMYVVYFVAIVYIAALQQRTTSVFLDDSTFLSIKQFVLLYRTYFFIFAYVMLQLAQMTSSTNACRITYGDEEIYNKSSDEDYPEVEILSKELIEKIQHITPTIGVHTISENNNFKDILKNVNESIKEDKQEHKDISSAENNNNINNNTKEEEEEEEKRDKNESYPIQSLEEKKNN
ncbi:hypothetical protein WA158_006690 [Blastocystis sp. Blastoise]